MDIGRLTDDLEVVLERARDVLDQEVARTRKTIDALNVERTTAQAALTQLADQHKEAKTQLDAVLKHLGKASSLAGLDSEITKAKAELKKLQGETEKASIALEGMVTHHAPLKLKPPP